jgi:hypothetical protein
MASRTRKYFLLVRISFVLAALLSFQLVQAARPAPERVPKWQRWELTLKSSVSYENPVQDAEVRVLFVSPLGETNRVYGFWDGSKTWKVRFKPGFPGRWKYFTMCSDTANSGLHGQSGEFLCTAAEGDSRLAAHGPVSVARDQQHLEHADRTPFFWLGDAAWAAALKATPGDWKDYLQQRAKQKFNTVQWRVLAPEDTGKSKLFTGTERIAVNPEAFRQLDAKVVAANQVGLLNAIAPLWEIGPESAAPLPEDQAIILFRYMVARWGADDVAWIVAFECDSSGAQAKRWQNIGRAVFNYVNHAPVILLPGESLWTLDAFRHERWVDILGIQTTTVVDENSLPWLLSGPLASERSKIPLRPLLAIVPPGESRDGELPGTIQGEFARRLLWWNALLNTPAGVSYSAAAVANWDESGRTNNATQSWREALVLPGAQAIAPLAAGVGQREFWKLRPSAQSLILQPGLRFAEQYQIAVRTESKDLVIVYTPENQPVVFSPAAVPDRSSAEWLNPRTGENRPASIPAGSDAMKFTPPEAGDWLLVLNMTREKVSHLVRPEKANAKIDKRNRD